MPSYEVAASGMSFAWGGASEVALASVGCVVLPSDLAGFGAAEIDSGSSSHCLDGAAVRGAVAASSAPSSGVVAAVAVGA